MKSFLLSIDARPFHMRPWRTLSARQRTVARYYATIGTVAILPRTRRFPKRLVVTGTGSDAIGTFDSC